MRVNWPSQEFRAKVGGRWSISWQAYALSIPLSVLAVFAAVAKHAQDRQDIVRAVVVAIVTTGLIGALLFVLHKTLYRRRYTQPVSLLVIAGTGVLAGAILSAGVSWGGWWLDARTPSNWWPQVIANSLLITWWGVTMTLVLGNRDEFSKRRDASITAALELELVKVRGSAIESRLRNALNQQITKDLDEVRSTLNEALDAPDRTVSDPQWQPVAQLMRAIARDVMRPLSKELWDSAAQAFPKPGLRQVLGTIVRQQPLRPLALSVLVVILSTQTLTETFGASVGLVVLAATVAFIWLSLTSASALMKRYAKYRLPLFGLTILGFQAFDTAAWVLAGRYANVEVLPVTLAVNVIASVVLILLTSGYGAYSAAEQEQLDTFARDINRAQMSVLVTNMVVSNLAMAAARNMHGKVQTRLLSCAAAIDRAVETMDVELLDRALHEVNDVFDTALVAQDDGAVLGLGRQLEQVAGQWAGLCSITLAVSPHLTNRTTRDSLDVAAAVEEAITNAVRHGHASQVRVEVTTRGNMLDIAVTDDGQGPAGGVPGVGTAMLRVISAGDMDITKDDGGGTRLRLTVPMTGY